jgi:hypothetical protein
MRSNFVQRAGTFYTAIPADVVMVTDAVEASFPVASLKIGLGKGLVGTGGGAMYHYQVYLSHTLRRI